jgi:error-prone DNA polymerase
MAATARVGLDPGRRALPSFVELWARIPGSAAHLNRTRAASICQGRLKQPVPEPTSMLSRVVVQWDKDDCADLNCRVDSATSG